MWLFSLFFFCSFLSKVIITTSTIGNNSVFTHDFHWTLVSQFPLVVVLILFSKENFLWQLALVFTGQTPFLPSNSIEQVNCSDFETDISWQYWICCLRGKLIQCSGAKFCVDSRIITYLHVIAGSQQSWKAASCSSIVSTRARTRKC